MPGFFRLPLLIIFLLVLAACSSPPERGAPRGLRALAGPHYAQLYWDSPEPDSVHVLEYRNLSDGGDWSAVNNAVIDLSAGTALVPLAASGEFEYRLGVWRGEQLLWSTADGTLNRHDGVKLQVGTFNRGDHDPAAGTALLIWFDLPEDVSLPVRMELTGPAGWAGEAHPMAVDPWQLDAGYRVEYLYALDALPGTYQLTATDDSGRAWSDSVTFSDDGFRLPAATDLEVTDLDLTAGSLTASWTPPVEGAFTQVSIIQVDNESTFADSHEFTELELTDADFILEVVASNALLQAAPRVMPVPFGVVNTRLEPERAD